MSSEPKTFSSAVALCLAAGGVGVPDVTFDNIHEAITHVLGYDVFTHELAEPGPWERARQAVRQQDPELAMWADRLISETEGLGQDREAWERWMAQFTDAYASTCRLCRGVEQRIESPLESMARIAPGKPVIVVTGE